MVRNTAGIGIKRATTGYDEKTRQMIDVAHNLFSWKDGGKVTPFDLSRLGYPKLEQVCSGRSRCRSWTAIRPTRS